jgi:hypothetical protein
MRRAVCERGNGTPWGYDVFGELTSREHHCFGIDMPEFPFEMQNRIRAVFYRPIQRDLAEATD